MWKNPEYRKHMSEVHKGKNMLEENKNKLSKRMKGNKYRVGKKPGVYIDGLRHGSARRKLFDMKKVCMICDEQKRKEIHHINSNGYDNNIWNLIPICRRCHYDIHIEMRRGGYDS